MYKSNKNLNKLFRAFEALRAAGYETKDTESNYEPGPFDRVVWFSGKQYKMFLEDTEPLKLYWQGNRQEIIYILTKVARLNVDDKGSYISI